MAANVAVSLARLGGIVRLLGAVGTDAAGEYALASLRSAGVDVSHSVAVSGAETFECISLIARTGEKCLVRLVTDAYLPTPDAVSKQALAGASHVHTTFGSPVLALRALDLARAAKLTRSLDIEVADIPSDVGLLRRALAKTDFLFCNDTTRSALDVVLGKPATMFVDIVITTLGDRGSRLERGDQLLEAPAFASTALDTTGAGDCFAAAFLFASLQQGQDWMDSLIFANAAAALSTQAYGAQGSLPDRQMVSQMVAKRKRQAALSEPT
jgi:ribokinase